MTFPGEAFPDVIAKLGEPIALGLERELQVPLSYELVGCCRTISTIRRHLHGSMLATGQLMRHPATLEH